MATVTKDYSRIIYSTSSTATSYTITADFYSMVDIDVGGYNHSFVGKLTGSFGTAVAHITRGSSTANTWYKITSKTKTVSKTTANQTFTFTWNAGFSAVTDGVWYGPYGGNATVTLTIPALASYNVTFNANGGSGAPATQKKYYGKNLTLSSTKPTRTGYTFVRWNTNTSNTGTAYNPGGSYTGNAALTLYAIWQANTWSVTYNANGGSGAPAAQTKVYGTTLTLSSSQPTRTGYVFVQWNTKSDGTGTSYASGASYTTNAALALYAIWRLNVFTISYNANGGINPPNDQTKTYDVDIQLSSSTPTRTDYQFINWNTRSDGTGTVYEPNATYTTNQNLTLYAIWVSTYIPPRIENLIAYRTDSAGIEANDGTYGVVVFNWISGTASEGTVNISAAKIGYREKGATNYTYLTVTDVSSNTITAIIGNNDLDVNSQYDIIAIITPTGTGRADISRSTYISKSSFVIDINANGTCVAVGQSAPDNFTGFIMAFDPYVSLDVTASSDTIDAKLYDAITALGWEDDVII